MAERSIVCNGDEVRRLLLGEVVELRRPAGGVTLAVGGVAWGGTHHLPHGILPVVDERQRVACPFGKAGELLWVKESWRSWESRCTDEPQGDDHECPGPHCHQVYVAYEATPRVGYRPTPDHARITYLDESSPLSHDRRLLGPWESPVKMPRWASRLTIDVGAVACVQTRGSRGWEWVLTVARSPRTEYNGS